MWHVYILQCKNGRLYTGVTSDLKRRLSEHIGYKTGKYTNYNRPEKVVYSEEFEHLNRAESRESQIKKWSRSKKQALINGKFDQLRELSKSRD